MRWPLLLACVIPLGACTCAASHGRDAEVDGAAPDTGAPDAFVTVDTSVADVGPPDGPVVTDCLSAFDAAEGQACDFDDQCFAWDLCCRADARCYDGRLSVTNPGDATCYGDERPTECTASVAMANAFGDTPLGPIDLPYAHASFSFAFAVNAMLIFTTEPTLITCRAPRLGVYFLPDAELGYVGDHEVIVQLVTDAGVARAPATLSITSHDREMPGHLEGNLVVRADGWSVDGRFIVDGCEDIDRSGP